jgi:hypothetical protein
MKIFLALIITLLFSLNVEGEVLGSYSTNLNGWSPSGIHDHVTIDFGISDWATATPIVNLFDDLPIDADDAGSHYLAVPCSEPNFDDVADFLTNGIIDGIGFEACAGACSGMATREPDAFPGLDGFDFYGYEIEQIELIIDSIELFSSHTSTTFDVDVTVKIYGKASPPIDDIRVEVQGGALQECTSPNGTSVTFYSFIEPAEHHFNYSFAWLVDGVPYDSGDPSNPAIAPLLSNGVHIITVEGIELTSGERITDAVDVEVLDTQPPDVHAAFVNSNTGQVITQASSKDKVSAMVVATDACDPEPTATATVGISADSGGIFSFDKSRKALSMKNTSNEENAILSVTATDSEGNVATEKAELRILQ